MKYVHVYTIATDFQRVGYTLEAWVKEDVRTADEHRLYRLCREDMEQLE